jgi:hypothetical protein
MLDFVRAATKPFVTIVALSLTLQANAVASCEPGTAPTYDDITAVLITRGYQSSFGHLERHGLTDQVAQSAFWAFFGSYGPGSPEAAPIYSQFTLKASQGTYELQLSLRDLVTILREDGFYNLYAPERRILDGGGYAVVTVLRCSVSTKLFVIDQDSYQTPSIIKLIADITSLISHSQKTKTSLLPSKFAQMGVFDPL